MKLAKFNSGIGVGWRPEISLAIEQYDSLGFIEITAENIYPYDSIPVEIRRLQQRGIKIIPHGVTLSLGSAEHVNLEKVKKFGNLAEQLKAPLISEHIAYVHAGGIDVGHLLPLPRTQETIDIVVENVRRAKQVLKVPLALENIATILDWPDQEMDEATFITEILNHTDTYLLLDVSNLYANSFNHGYDPLDFLNNIPLHRLAYVHISGGVLSNGLYRDTHSTTVSKNSLDVLEELCTYVDPPGILLERDENYPTKDELHAELKSISETRDRGLRYQK